MKFIFSLLILFSISACSKMGTIKTSQINETQVQSTILKNKKEASYAQNAYLALQKKRAKE